MLMQNFPLRRRLRSKRWRWQAVWRLLRGERLLRCYDEPVVVVREFWKMTRSQQEALRSEGINRHEWERRPLGGHAACSCIEHGRLVDCRDLWRNTVTMMIEMSSTTNVKKSSCWLDAWYSSSVSTPRWKSSLHLQRSKIEKVSIRRTRMSIELFAEGMEDLYTTVLEPYIRKTPAFAGCVCNEMMRTRSWWCVLTPHCHLKNLKRLLRALFQDRLLYFVAKSGKPAKYSFSSVQRACGDSKGGETTRWRRHDDEETRRWRRHGDEAAMTRWHDDMTMRWTLCGDNMTTGGRNSAERRGLLSRIAAMVTTAMVTAPTATIYYQNACNLPISMIFCQQG